MSVLHKQLSYLEFSLSWKWISYRHPVCSVYVALSALFNQIYLDISLYTVCHS